MREAIDVFCLGETMVMVTSIDGESLAADSSYLLRPGGAESNVATSLAGLGHTTVWASALGSDPLGDLVLDEIRSHGTDVSLVARDTEHRTGVYFKDPSPSGTAVYYYRDNSAASHLSPAVLKDWVGVTPRVVHVSGITAALSASCRALLDSIVFDRAFGTAQVSFDVNFRPRLWSVDNASPVLRDLARASDIVFVGRDEAETLWGTATPESVSDLIEGPSHLVVKDGAHDAQEFHNETQTRCPAPAVNVLEPVGAGDAFAAGWLAGLLRGHSADERLRFGHLMASRVLVSSTDSAPAPTAAIIAAAIRADPSEWPRA